MAVKVNAIDSFRKLAMPMAEEAVKRLEAGGLGAMFHDAVVDLFEEMKDAPEGDIRVAFNAAMAEMESEVKDYIKTKLGVDESLSGICPLFRDYKSAYGRMIDACNGAFDTVKFSGPGSIKRHLAALNKKKADAMKGKGAAGDGSGGLDLESLSGSARHYLEQAVRKLGELPESEQTRVTRNFKEICFAEQAKGRKKTAASAGGGANTKDAA